MRIPLTTRRLALAASTTCTAFALMAMSPVSQAQSAYGSPDQAVQALIDGVSKHDASAVKDVLGKESRKLVPLGGNARAREDLRLFLDAYREEHRVVPATDGASYLEVGKDNWRFPIPIVSRDAGKTWSFDPKTGENVIRARLMSRNQWSTINNVLDYVDAQQYYRETRVQAGLPPEYALKVFSSRGKRDGLYWPKRAGWPDSPLGRLSADMGRKVAAGKAFFGYYYGVLHEQGPNAPGGARNYLQDGHLTGGFGVIAWPAKYGETGVMTFIANQEGTVYQKDLGPDSAAKAAALKAFDPDSSWVAVKKHGAK